MKFDPSAWDAIHATPIRICTKCKIEKPQSEDFYRLSPHKQRVDGSIPFRSVCKQCDCDAQKARYKNDPNAKERERLRALKERERRASYSAKRRAEKADFILDWRLRTKYGLTREKYAGMIDAQDGKCAICSQPLLLRDGPGPSRGRARAVVDHCHVTTLVRAILCMGCNSGLGHFSDNPATLRAAAAYLERHATGGNQ